MWGSKGAARHLVLYLRDCPASPSWKLWPERQPAPPTPPREGPAVCFPSKGPWTPALRRCCQEPGAVPVLWLKAWQELCFWPHSKVWLCQAHSVGPKSCQVAETAAVLRGLVCFLTVLLMKRATFSSEAEAGCMCAHEATSHPRAPVSGADPWAV